MNHVIRRVASLTLLAVGGALCLGALLTRAELPRFEIGLRECGAAFDTAAMASCAIAPVALFAGCCAIGTAGVGSVAPRFVRPFLWLLVFAVVGLAFGVWVIGRVPDIGFRNYVC